MMSFKGVGAALLVLALVSYQVSADGETTVAAPGGDAAAGATPAATDAGAGGGGAKPDADKGASGGGGDGGAAAGGAAGGGDAAGGDAAGGSEAPAAAEGEATTAASGAGEFQALTKFVAVMAAVSVGLLAKKD